MRPATLKAKDAKIHRVSYWKILDMVKKSEIPHSGRDLSFRQVAGQLASRAGGGKR